MQPRARVSRVSALTIAGSDSGGGAGVQADLKTFAALGVHGTSVVTCLTAQNPRAVLALHPVTPVFVRRQWEAVVAELPPRAVKTGMLHSAAIIREVADLLRSRGRLGVVVDPVMVATSRARLLQPAAITTLQRRLLPLAMIATPNLDETEILTGVVVRSPEDLRHAARVLRDRYGCAALIKGGHLPGAEAVDVFWDGEEELLLRSPRVRGVSSHGTGCTYSAAIAGYYALGCDLSQAVQLSKEYITQAIAQSGRVGRHAILEHFWRG